MNTFTATPSEARLMRARASLTLFAVLAIGSQGVGRAEVYDIPGTAFGPDTAPFFIRTPPGGQFFSERAHMATRVTSVATTVDTVADTATLKSAVFVTEGQNRSWVRSVPGDFPNPPIQFRETITFNNPIVAPIELVSSSAAPLLPFFGDVFAAYPTVTLRFPSQFTVTGTYTAEGPQESKSVPFSVNYDLAGGNTSILVDSRLRVRTGSNFPATASTQLTYLQPSGFYTPSNPVIFDGTVNGVAVRAEFVPEFLLAGLVPEPTTCWMSVLAVAALARARRHRHGPPRRRDRSAASSPS